MANCSYCCEIYCSCIGRLGDNKLFFAWTKWNFLPFKPGLVGGHCIGVDPYYLAQKETLEQNQRAKLTRVYPSIQEQLDMQYWDNVNGTTNWEDAIAKVKTDNPKE